MSARKWKIKLVVAVALFVVAQIVFAIPSAASAVPIKLGTYTPYAPGNGKILDEYAEMVGRQPDIVLYYKDFFMPLMEEDQIANLKARGETPMITWEPAQPTSGFPDANLADIASGKYDSTIQQAARLVRSYSSEVMIRFGHEMNISASLWGPGKDGNVGNTFVEAWQHIVSIFRQEGATNAKWVWSPNVDWGGVPFTQYFPGDSWVDYVALDGYNWGAFGTEIWQNMSHLFSDSYRAITQLSSKPVIFAETSSGENGGSKAEWIREGFLHTIPEEFPRVYAVVWFNADAEEDWRINTSPSALQAYREVVSSSLYGGPDPAPGPVTEESSELKSLVVTPSSASSPKMVSSQNPKVVYKVTRKAPVRIVLRRMKRHRPLRRGARSIEVTMPRRRASISVARLAGGHSLPRGSYLVTATVMGNSGPRRSRHATFKIVSPASAPIGVGTALEAS